MPIKTTDRTINVITELIDCETQEKINPFNSSNCPPFVILNAMYPFLWHPVSKAGDSVPYVIIENDKGVRTVSNLSGISPSALVRIKYLYNINDDTVYTIGAFGNLFC
ncbi:MAG: hypothetical protein LBU51_07940, partial [Bacteroidales bacterium]|nr:hypothetical protein [Bacteroidales bacterium]